MSRQMFLLSTRTELEGTGQGCRFHQPGSVVGPCSRLEWGWTLGGTGTLFQPEQPLCLPWPLGMWTEHLALTLHTSFSLHD